MKKIILGNLLIILTSSCNLREIKYSDDELENLKHKILLNKDIISYSDYSLYLDHKDTLCNVELLPYHLKMMEVDSANSYFCFFNTFLRVKFNRENPKDIIKLAKPEQDLLIYYLNKGSDNGSYECKSIIIDLYQKGIYYKKNKSKADSLFFVAYGYRNPNR